MSVVERKIVHGKADHAYEVTQSFGTYGRRGAVTYVEEVSTRVNAFVMRYVECREKRRPE